MLGMRSRLHRDLARDHGEPRPGDDQPDRGRLRLRRAPLARPTSPASSPGRRSCCVAVATGITAALLAVPALRPVLLAVVGRRTSSGSRITSRRRHRSRAGRRARPPPSLAGGALLGVANPKAWVAIARGLRERPPGDAARRPTRRPRSRPDRDDRPHQRDLAGRRCVARAASSRPAASPRDQPHARRRARRLDGRRGAPLRHTLARHA